MTLSPDPKTLIHLFNFYDSEVKRLVVIGFSKVDAEYNVKHFLDMFAYDPEMFRADLEEGKRKK